MPYRATINTDAGRLGFLERCLMQNENDSKKSYALLEPTTVTRMEKVLPEFKQLVVRRGKEAADQLPAVTAKDEAKSNCGLWVSHFFQVLNLWNVRELHDDGLFKYYGMDMRVTSLPSLRTDDDVLLWGDRLLNGEEQRIANGGKPMVNPSAADFQPIFADYRSKLQAVQKEKFEADAAEEAVARIRPEVDDAIGDAIAEMEFKLRKLDNTSIRRKLRTYGVKYAYREGEAVEPEEVEPTAAVGA